jgi:AbrB family looped-hinge helix DNA binding protein
MTVTVKRIGGSVAVVIPKAVARELNLTEGSALSLTTKNDVIVMRKNRRPQRRTLSEVVARIKPANYRRRRLELGQDAPVGKEAW